MFRRMRQALHDIGDNSDEEDPKTETNDDGDGSESNVVEENEGEEQTEEMEEGSGKQGQVGEEEAGDEEQIGEDEDEEQTGGAEDEDRLGGAEDEDQAGEVEGEEQTGEGEGEGEETIQVIQVVQIVENPTTDPPPGISRTMSDPVTQTEQSQVEDKKHPPIKILNPVTQEWPPKHAVIDTGCDDDWISHSTALQLNLTIVPFDDPPKMTMFSGEPMNPVGQAMVTWEATSTGRTAETLANVAENGPFDFLLGSNFYWGKDGESYFDEPVEILRMSKKPTDDESSDMKATHARRIQAGAAAATARQQATKEENSKLRNSAPQQDLEEEEEDGGGEYD